MKTRSKNSSLFANSTKQELFTLAYCVCLAIALGMFIFLMVRMKMQFESSPTIYQSETLPQTILLTSDIRPLFNQYADDTSYMDEAAFGAYTMEPIDDVLYIGISGGSPGNFNGTLLAKYQEGLLTPIIDSSTQKSPIREQGMHDMTYTKGTLYIPGTDPQFGWEAGEIYTYKPGGEIVMHRTMTNVLHSLGLWVDNSGTIYVGTGSHKGDNETWIGQVFKSSTQAETWSKIASVSKYRIYDLIGFNSQIYAISSDYWTTELKKASTELRGWKTIRGISPSIYPRLLIFNGNLIGVDGSQTKLYKIDSGNKLTTYNTGFTIARSFNVLATDGEYLYVLSADNAIYRSQDLSIWTAIASSTKPVASIAYWPSKDYLVYTEKDPNPSLWAVELAGI